MKQQSYFLFLEAKTNPNFGPHFVQLWLIFIIIFHNSGAEPYITDCTLQNKEPGMAVTLLEVCTAALVSSRWRYMFAITVQTPSVLQPFMLRPF